jgi:uncharacterized protein YbaR (Trm112 family)
VTLADTFLPKAAKDLVTKARRQKRAPARKVNLESILACPACGSDVKVLRDAVKCHGCSRVYPIEQGFPMMLLDQEMRHRPSEDEGQQTTDDEASETREMAARGGATIS